MKYPSPIGRDTRRIRRRRSYTLKTKEKNTIKRTNVNSNAYGRFPTRKSRRDLFDAVVFIESLLYSSRSSSCRVVKRPSSSLEHQEGPYSSPSSLVASLVAPRDPHPLSQHRTRMRVGLCASRPQRRRCGQDDRTSTHTPWNHLYRRKGDRTSRRTSPRG